MGAYVTCTCGAEIDYIDRVCSLGHFQTWLPAAGRPIPSDGYSRYGATAVAPVVGVVMTSDNGYASRGVAYPSAERALAHLVGLLFEYSAARVDHQPEKLDRLLTALADFADNATIRP